MDRPKKGILKSPVCGYYSKFLAHSQGKMKRIVREPELCTQRHGLSVREKLQNLLGYRSSQNAPYGSYDRAVESTLPFVEFYYTLPPGVKEVIAHIFPLIKVFSIKPANFT